MEAEHGFVMIHVAMVRHTPRFVKAVTEVLESASQDDREKFVNNLEEIVMVMKDINSVMEKMWVKSNPSDYIKFRTFIMGTKGQNEMFPNGVIYEGVDKEPTFYRGESGANDSIVPTCDNLLQLVILTDFRLGTCRAIQ